MRFNLELAIWCNPLAKGELASMNFEAWVCSFEVSLLVTMYYLHSYFVGVPAWVPQGSSGATSKKQHYYFSVGTSAVTV